MKKGDKVVLTLDGVDYEAEVVIASSNGTALMVRFEHIIDGHLGMMPVLKDPDWDDEYLAVATATRVKLRNVS